MEDVRSPAAQNRPAAGPRWRPGQASDRRWCPPRDWLDTRCRRLVRLRRWPWRCDWRPDDTRIRQQRRSSRRRHSLRCLRVMADGRVACDTPGLAHLFHRADEGGWAWACSSGDGVPRRTFLRYGALGAALALGDCPQSAFALTTPVGDCPRSSALPGDSPRDADLSGDESPISGLRAERADHRRSATADGLRAGHVQVADREVLARASRRSTGRDPRSGR